MADSFSPYFKRQKTSRGALLVAKAGDMQAKAAHKQQAAVGFQTTRTPQPLASVAPRRPPVTPVTPASVRPALEPPAPVDAPAVGSPPAPVVLSPVFPATAAHDGSAAVAPVRWPAPPQYGLTAFMRTAAHREHRVDGPAVPPPPRPVLATGLVNLGHTCYLNTVLQVLYSLPGFRADVQCAAERFRAELPAVSVVAALHRCFVAMDARPSVPLRGAPQDVHTALSRAPDGVKFRSLLTQHDAHEVLLHAMDTLAAEVAACVTGAADAAAAAATEWCPTRKSFSAVTRARLLCSGCQAIVDVPECMRALSLELPPGEEPVDVMQLLTHAFAAEAGVERRCDGCGHNVATLSRSLAAMPQVLVLHVKRFTTIATAAGAMLRKVMRPVCSELSLDVAPLCAARVHAPLHAASQAGPCASDGDASRDSEALAGSGRENAATLYRLHAVVHHIGGSLGAGHYTVDIRNDDTTDPFGSWLRFNDEHVSRITEGQVLAMQREAYMLVYTHCGRPGDAARTTQALATAGAVLRERNW